MLKVARTIFFALFSSGLFLFSTESLATMMRCHGKLVQVGMTDYSVQKACGDPLSKKSFQETSHGVGVYGGGFSLTVNIERWIYQPTQSFQYILRFENGRLKSIINEPSI